MSDSHAAARRQQDGLPREEIQSQQLQRLNDLLQHIRPGNEFWTAKLADWGPLHTLDELEALPLTTKQELIAAAAEAPSSLLTYAQPAYSRVHRTSGTTGAPYYVYDTPEDWKWWIETWQYVLDAADITTEDRATMAFSYGPFIGFWSAHDALVHRGAMVVPTGGMSSLARLRCLRDVQSTVVFCTPTYALRLWEVARENGQDLHTLPVRAIIVAGEPGGSDPQIRAQIEQAWDAVVIDHAGATEIGPWGYAAPERNGLRVVESEFIAEFLPRTSKSAGGDTKADDAAIFELVLTSLGRRGMPVIRYRTGDLVRPVHSPHGFVLLDGGVLGRADDMLTIRGVNVFPTAIESIIRAVHPLAEFRIIVREQRALQELHLQVEGDESLAGRMQSQLRTALGLRIEVEPVLPGSLERFEGKARRMIREK